ncbi:hypothetical protein [Mesorhizobium sp.]|nr:hypothetical protein [Mesorhizobium sp.]
MTLKLMIEPYSADYLARVGVRRHVDIPGRRDGLTIEIFSLRLGMKWR